MRDSAWVRADCRRYAPCQRTISPERGTTYSDESPPTPNEIRYLASIRGVQVSKMGQALSYRATIWVREKCSSWPIAAGHRDLPPPRLQFHALNYAYPGPVR